jgi:hypothetical protein
MPACRLYVIQSDARDGQSPQGHSCTHPGLLMPMITLLFSRPHWKFHKGCRRCAQKEKGKWIGCMVIIISNEVSLGKYYSRTLSSLAI